MTKAAPIFRLRLFVFGGCFDQYPNQLFCGIMLSDVTILGNDSLFCDPMRAGIARVFFSRLRLLLGRQEKPA